MAAVVRPGLDERGELALTIPGFIILAHENLNRVAELARYLSLYGAVVIHVDRRVSHAGLDDLGARVDVISTRACDWGMISLVDATLDAARHLLARHDVGHVCLLSGSCLPTRPLDQLVSFLDVNRDTDFIESIPVAEADWVQGGLSYERFSLWFPVNWQKRRRLFDALVWLQRKARVRRRIPDGLKPHLGLQWWCLTAGTLRAILGHPQLLAWRRYFAWNWIPDESFFQTLVHQVSTARIDARPLTLQRFDHRGRPFVFHDDHDDLLRTSPHFFARKIDPDAVELYTRYLSDMPSGTDARPAFGEEVNETPFELARMRDRCGGRGLLSASKMTSGTTPSHVETVRPYAVLVSRSNDLMRRIREAHMGGEVRLHGHLFGVFPARFAEDFSEVDGLGPGCLPMEPVQRDYRDAQYLAKVLWIGRDRPSAFLFNPIDNRFIRGTIFSDPNARLILLGDEAALLQELGEPLRNAKGRQMRASVRRAWSISLPEDRDESVQQALTALRSDWDDPSGWTLPDGSGGSHA